LQLCHWPQYSNVISLIRYRSDISLISDIALALCSFYENVRIISIAYVSSYPLPRSINAHPFLFPLSSFFFSLSSFVFFYIGQCSVLNTVADATKGDPVPVNLSRDFFSFFRQQKRGKSGYIDSNRLRKPFFSHDRHPSVILWDCHWLNEHNWIME